MEISMKRRQMLLSTIALSSTLLSSLLSEQKAHLAGLKCAAENCERCQQLDNDIQARTVGKHERPIFNKIDSYSSQI
jgi:hypothetical protein